MSRQSSIAIFSMKITMNFLFFASLLCSCLTTTKAYTLNNNNNPTSRREWMVKTFATPLATVVVVGTTTALPQPANAVISSKYCAYGTGEGCDDLAEGNEFIKQLQAKSAANKETIQAVRKNSFYPMPCVCFCVCLFVLCSLAFSNQNDQIGFAIILPHWRY